MQPIWSWFIYWDKKLKKRLHVLEADIIKYFFLQNVFQMTVNALMTHLNLSSVVVIHPDTDFFLVWHESSDWWPLCVRQLQLTCEQSQKWASSLNQISSRMSGSSSNLFLNRRHITKHLSMSAEFMLDLDFVLVLHTHTQIHAES